MVHGRDINVVRFLHEKSCFCIPPQVAEFDFFFFEEN